MQWHKGSIAEAVSEAKHNNKLFLVYVEGEDDMSKTMTRTYNDSSVSASLTPENVIAVKLTANSVPYMQFCEIYPVLVIPSSFFIAGNGTLIEVTSGSRTPEEFLNKLAEVMKLYEEKYSKKKPIDLSAPSTSSQHNEVPASSIVDINQPSTSQAMTHSEPVPTLEEKVKRAQALMEAKRQAKALEEQEQEKSGEMARRTEGKAMQQAQLSKKENEMKEWAKNHAKEKEEERLAREKVKAMIAQDRAEQAARYQRVKEAENAERRQIQQRREEEERAAREAAMNSNDARIQFRLPDGSYSTNCFSADATLEEARAYVRQEVRPPFSNFSLCTTFPRRHFTENDYPQTLRDLQLSPSAVLLILPAQAVTRSNTNSNFITDMFWLLLSPVTSLWNYITSFFRSNNGTPPPRPNRNVPATQSSTRQDTPDEGESSKPPTVRRREPTFTKREGNIYRINNQSDDDENNTWNGNSTQQM